MALRSPEQVSDVSLVNCSRFYFLPSRMSSGGVCTIPTAVIIHKIQFIQLLLKERKEPLKFLIKAESQKAVTGPRDPRNKKQETINIGTNLRGER